MPCEMTRKIPARCQQDAMRGTTQDAMQILYNIGTYKKTAMPVAGSSSKARRRPRLRKTLMMLPKRRSTRDRRGPGASDPPLERCRRRRGRGGLRDSRGSAPGRRFIDTEPCHAAGCCSCRSSWGGRRGRPPPVKVSWRREGRGRGIGKLNREFARTRAVITERV
jgi:hypothetical protein